MKKRALFALAACLLASAGCEPSAPEIGDPPSAPAAVPEPPHPDAAAPHRHSVKYSISRIGDANMGETLVRINNRGQILFHHQITECLRRVALKSPVVADLPYKKSVAADINDAGTVVGNIEGEDSLWDASHNDPNSYGVIWQNGKGALFSLISLEHNSVINRINNHGDFVGYSDFMYNDKTQESQHAILCQGGKLIDLGVGTGECLNDKNQVIICYPGFASLGEGAWAEPFVWDKGTKTPIKTPPGYKIPEAAAGINNSGQVAITLSRLSPYNVHDPDDRDWQQYAFTWRSGTMTKLGTFGGINSTAEAINNKGQIVGRADTTRKSKEWLGSHQVAFTQAFLWQHGHLYDLNDLIPRRSGWVLGDAVSINDKGQIVGTGNKGAFLLTPLNTGLTL